MKQALLIFTKNLIYGQVKTRLAATVGNDMALTVYKHLLQHTASITHYLPVDKIVFYSNAVEKPDIWNDNVYKKQVQFGNNLGERMRNAFIYAFEQGNKEVAIIGTDCLEITSAIIMNAFAYLTHHDVVIGPASDGGYYLLAMKQMHHQIFQSINWSTNEVLKQTLAVFNNLSLSVHLLTELSDIDTSNDLEKIKEQLTTIKSK